MMERDGKISPSTHTKKKCGIQDNYRTFSRMIISKKVKSYKF